MFTVNLETELIRSKKASLSKDEQVILAEAEKIINGSTAEDLKILQSMGLNHSIEKSRALENKLNFIKAFDKTRVFSEAEIKELCMTYGLRFLPIRNFRGEIDPVMPSKVKEFEAVHKQVMNSSTNARNNHWSNEFRYDKFKICAPEASFQLSERPVDPLLFYPLPNDTDNEHGRDYFLVHKWGNDISGWNAIKAWRKKHFGTWITYLFTVYMLPLAVIASMFIPELSTFLRTLGVAACGTVACILLPIFANGDHFSKVFTNDVWNSEFRD